MQRRTSQWFSQARFGPESSESGTSEDADDDGILTAEDLVDVLRDEIDLIHSAMKALLDWHDQEIAELQQAVRLLIDTCERLVKAIPRDSLGMSAGTS